MRALAVIPAIVALVVMIAVLAVAGEIARMVTL